jgi:hypothetical protein
MSAMSKVFVIDSRCTIENLFLVTFAKPLPLRSETLSQIFHVPPCPSAARLTLPAVVGRADLTKGHVPEKGRKPRGNPAFQATICAFRRACALLGDEVEELQFMEFNKGAVGIFVTLCAIGGATGYFLATSGAPEPVLGAAPTALVADSTTQTPAQPAANFAPAPVATPQAPPTVIERRAATARPLAAPAPAPRSVAVRERPAPAPVENQRPIPSVVRDTTPVPAPAPAFEPAPVEAPPAPQFVDLVVPAESVIGLQMETTVSSETARLEDEVIAHVSRDVRVGDRVAIPSGAKAYGHVTLVERGGRLRERARLGIRFTLAVLADGTRIPLETDTIYREGDSPANESAAKIGGGAIGGAIIGGILGGAKGAMIGGSIGAGAGTAAVYTGGRNAATFTSGTPVTVRLVEPADVTVEY